MIRQAFKLMWNQRRKHLGLSFEILFSFMVLFAVFSFGFHNLDKYLDPLGFSYKNVWVIESLDRGAENDSIALVVDNLIQQNLKNFPEIDQVSFSAYNLPFSGSTITNNIDKDNASENAQIHWVDNNYSKTMEIELAEGRWFNEEDRAYPQTAVVITKDLAKFLFPNEPPIGKTFDYSEKGSRVVGMIDNFHYKGGVLESPHAVFLQKKSDRVLPSLILKVNSKADAQFEARLLKMLQQIAPSTTIEIRYIEEMRKDYLLLSIIPVLVLGIIGTFLIFNVALGLFGVLWQNVSQRKQEIGVRRAMGSSQFGITSQFVLEVLVLATISLILGIFFAVQFPLLNVFEVKTGIYLAAIIFAIIGIYLLVFVCAVIPSAKAAKLHPAIALREE